jgi:tetratricopeptide (TPR) repeat protein
MNNHLQRFAFAILFTFVAAGAFAGSVEMAEEAMTIPTYRLGAAERNPMFYTRESYQGAQKRIYPYPMQDFLTQEKTDTTYTALRLENDYVRLRVLPQLGGRIFEGLDKTNGYDFFYRQHVIKPALIGMLGAWISGGVEWCCFHHHRNTTFMPVDSTMGMGGDGSKTIWIGETERRHRMRWLIGLTLYPDKSYIEATMRFFNGTPEPNSILFWANVAVHANDQYQILFPPSVNTATYHSKIDFTRWPISQETYRGSNYRGVDISWWKNSPEQNSFFAWDKKEDFMGGYDHGKDAGLVHVADHNIVCGAKLWEWGTGPSGRMWDKILTDEDGPYAELMVGAFSDNQPDYSWIKPYEVKTWKQYWYPVRGIGGFKNANLDGAVNLELRDGKALIGFYSTSKRSGAKAILKSGDKVIFDETIDIAPDKPFRKEVTVPPGTKETDLRAALVTSSSKELIAYQPVERKPVDKLPETVKPPRDPKEIENIEELYLTGLRVEQIHNPSVDPLDYYNEAIRRDPGDSRSNTALAIDYNKRGMYEDAEKHARKAIERISEAYTRPRNTEASYQLGIALRGQGRYDEAYEQFYRATWDSAFHSAAYYQLAELSCRKGEFAQALDQIESSLATNARNGKALCLEAAILRTLGRSSEAMHAAFKASVQDQLDFRAMNEVVMNEGGGGAAQELVEYMTQTTGGDAQSCLELATDYLNCGLWDNAIQVLVSPVRGKIKPADSNPMLYYYLGFAHEKKGDKGKATEYYAQAMTMPPDYCFPFRLEEIDILNAAIAANPNDARAYYYLGNLLYDNQPEKAMAAWEKSRALDGNFVTVHRNLGFANYRARNDVKAAVDCYEKAIACSGTDPRLFLELDTLYELANVAPDRRLAALDKNHETVVQRNESFIREITVRVLAGQYDRAIDDLANHAFHVREGGGEIHDVFVDAHLLKGLALMKEKKFDEALKHFEKASEYPENLSVGRPRFDRRAPQVAYHIGAAHEALGQAEAAREFFAKSADQRGAGSDPQARYCQALALRKLGRTDEAAKVFDDLIATGEKRLSEGEAADFFAKFGEKETRAQRLASAHFTLGLGYLGKGQPEKAKPELQKAAEMNQSHVWAKYQLAAFSER